MVVVERDLIQSIQQICVDGTILVAICILNIDEYNQLFLCFIPTFDDIVIILFVVLWHMFDKLGKDERSSLLVDGKL